MCNKTRMPHTVCCLSVTVCPSHNMCPANFRRWRPSGSASTNRQQQQRQNSIQQTQMQPTGSPAAGHQTRRCERRSRRGRQQLQAAQHVAWGCTLAHALEEGLVLIRQRQLRQSGRSWQPRAARRGHSRTGLVVVAANTQAPSSSHAAEFCRCWGFLCCWCCLVVSNWVAMCNPCIHAHVLLTSMSELRAHTSASLPVTRYSPHVLTHHTLLPMAESNKARLLRASQLQFSSKMPVVAFAVTHYEGLNKVRTNWRRCCPGKQGFK